MKFAANLTWLFTELPFLDRPRAAAEAGFDAVEVLFPYETPPERLAEAISAAGLSLALINTPDCDTRGRAAIPGDERAFREDFARAADYARRAGAAFVHVMSGVTDDRDAGATLRTNLLWATREAPDLALAIEPLNPRDMPGYALADVHRAARIVAETGAANLRLQFDAYHAEMIHGDAAGVFRAVAPAVGHVQIAAAPHRGEPDAATLAVIETIHRSGYDGVVSAEYRPGTDTHAGLGWLTEARRIAESPLT